MTEGRSLKKVGKKSRGGGKKRKWRRRRNRRRRRGEEGMIRRRRVRGRRKGRSGKKVKVKKSSGRGWGTLFLSICKVEGVDSFSRKLDGEKE